MKRWITFLLLCLVIVILFLAAYTGAKSALASQNIQLSAYAVGAHGYKPYKASLLNKIIFQFSQFSNSLLSKSSPVKQLQDTQLKPLYIHQSKMQNGYTLLTHHQKAEALLIDERGKILYRWYKDPHQIWAFHPNKNIIISKAKVYPDGRLLALYEATDSFLNGIGLVMLDKDSQVIWEIPMAAQKDFVTTSEYIFVLTQGLSNYHGLKSIADSISSVSTKGEIIKVESIKSLFEKSDYISMIPANSFRTFHCSSIRTIQSPFKLGNIQIDQNDLLISIKNIDVIAILCPDTWSIKWATQGLANNPLDALMLSDKSLLVFDSLGNQMSSNLFNGSSRISKINLESSQYSWVYSGQETMQPFSITKGCYLQKLPNSNILISMDKTRVIELSTSKHIVWELELPVCYAYRYLATELPFLRANDKSK